RRASRPRLSRVAGLVPVFVFLPESLFAAEFRPVFAVRLVTVLWSCLVTRIVASARIAIGIAGLAPGRAWLLFRRRLTAGPVRQRLDADVVFLVRTPDLDREGCCHPLGNFELGGRVHNPDSADVTLVDAAATADHRQEPAR